MRTVCSYCQFYASQGAALPINAYNPSADHLAAHVVHAEAVPAKENAR